MAMARQCTDAAIPVLLTRPEAEARAFAGAMAERFGNRLRPVVAPLMAVDYLAPALPPGPFVGVIFTSAAAVEAAVRLGWHLPACAWCVGRKTAERATAAGFQARSADGDAAALVAAILADPPGGRLLHLRGEETRGDIANRLISAGIDTASATVYRQLAQPMPAEGRALLRAGGPVIVPLFSPRSAELLRATLPPDLTATVWLVAMSESVAFASADIPHRAIDQARQPNADAMLDAIGLALDRTAVP